MEKSRFVSILGIEESDLIKFEEKGEIIKTLYKFNGLYHSFWTDDISDVNAGSSFSTDSLEEAEDEYNSF